MLCEEEKKIKNAYVGQSTKCSRDILGNLLFSYVTVLCDLRRGSNTLFFKYQ